jgi:transposase-like protein
MFMVCVDGLSGIPEAIKSVYPKAQVQLCIVHLVRAADLQKIDQPASVLEAETELENLSKKWDAKYPTIWKQWKLKCPHIIAMFELPMPIRKATYTTNVIESVNSVIRKFAGNRKQYPNHESALKLITWRSTRHQNFGRCRHRNGKRPLTTLKSSIRRPNASGQHPPVVDATGRGCVSLLGLGLSSGSPNCWHNLCRGRRPRS